MGYLIRAQLANSNCNDKRPLTDTQPPWCVQQVQIAYINVIPLTTTIVYPRAIYVILRAIPRLFSAYVYNNNNNSRSSTAIVFCFIRVVGTQIDIVR